MDSFADAVTFNPDIAVAICCGLQTLAVTPTAKSGLKDDEKFEK
jgi:hypothetical protein